MDTNEEFDSDTIFNKFEEERMVYQRAHDSSINEIKRLGRRGVIGPNTPLSGYVAFGVSSTMGARPADIYDSAVELNMPVIQRDEYFRQVEEERKKHQELSRIASAGIFKGGLVNHNEKTIKLHTAHHLLLAGLKAIVDKNIKQRGSNINEERLRMDFLCDHKLTDEEKKKVEDWVNDKIERGLNVIRRQMPLAEAEKLGAEMEFGTKYPETVSLYFIEDEKGNIISKEFCAGPHVSNTKELAANPDGALKHFKIQKEEAVAQGIRRIKAVLVV